MAYRLAVRNPKLRHRLYNVDKEPYFVSWFENSWDRLQCGGVSQAIYEETYGVKLIYDEPMNTISSVEFPDEGSAILFVLEWS